MSSTTSSVSYFNAFYNLGKTDHPPGSNPAVTITKTPCCEKFTSWLKWTVSLPITVPVTIAHTIANSYLLKNEKSLSGPLRKNVRYEHTMNYFPFFNFQFHVPTNEKISAILLKGYRSDGETYQDRANVQVFMTLFRRMYPQEKTITASDCLMTCSADLVESFRKPILEFVGQTSLLRHVAALETVAAQFAKECDTKEAVDVDDLVGRYTTTVIAQLFLDIPGPFQEIYLALKTINKNVMKDRWVTLSKEQNTQYEEAIKVLRGAIQKAIDCAKEGSFVAALNQSNLSNLQKRTTLALMFLGGAETTSSALKYCFWRLGQFPDYQAEIATAKEDGQIALIGSFMKEAFRMAPPAGVIGRFAANDLNLTARDSATNINRTFKIGKGDGILVSPLILGRNPHIYKKPNQFNPDRFRDHSSINNMPWHPFGGGRHACPGQWLAKAEIANLIRVIVKQYEFTSSPIQDDDLTQNLYMTMQFREKVTLSMKPRWYV